ncbi:MAG: creatinine amidohydrolase [Chloroflexota bacterium]
MLDNRATWPEFQAQRPEVAVLGIGAVEQHGPHLPVGTDLLAVEALARLVAERLDAWLLPSIPVSLSECHGPLGGTVWLKPATLAAVLRDIARSLEEQGVRVLVVINGHGGNFILEPTVERLNRDLRALKVLLAPESLALLPGQSPIFATADREVHAGEVETSVMLHLRPELVRSARPDGVVAVGREFLDYVTIDRLNPDGVWGCPVHADPQKGERALTARVEAIVGYVLGAVHWLARGNHGDSE